jgi:hypothetical protein
LLGPNRHQKDVPMQAISINQTIRELDAVNKKLDMQRVTGTARLALLRRQAELGDLREAARDAGRRAAAAGR